MPRLSAARLAAAALVLAGAGFGAGCTPSLPDPVVNSVHPAWGFNGEDTPVEIDGQSFYPRVQASGGDRVELDHGFRVFLEADPEVELGDVQVLDYRHLLGTIPAGVAVGDYDLRVESPTGAVGRLDQAFEVRDTRADQLLVTPVDGQVSWQVQEYASLSVELVDPDGARVAEDLEVQVVIDGVEPDTISFQADTLQDQAPLADGTGISGRLGPDGAATLALTSALAAEAVILRVDALDPDSGITGALQLLSFTPGVVAGVRIDLPSEVFDTTAGDSFDVDLVVVDQAGNAVEGADTLLVLQELCPSGDLLRSVSFAGQQEAVTVSVTAATQDGCIENAIVAVGVAAGTFVQGQSAPFQVAPDEPAALSLDVWPDEVTAGEEEVLAFITAVDDWGNRASSLSGPVELEVSADGGPFSAPPWSSCTELDQGEGWCRSLLDQAGSSVVLFASTSGPGSVSGVSAPFTVLAGEAVALQVDVDVDPAQAGQPFELRLTAVDALGNGVWLDPLGADVPAFSAGGDGADPDLACDWDRTEEGSTAEVYACTLTTAADARWIEVELPSLGLSAASGTFAVENGPLEAVQFTLSTVQVTAGDALSVRITGTDAWGNPYVVQDDPVLDLSDDTLDLSPTEATLGPDGTVTIDVVITVADEADQLYAAQDGRRLGSSAPFSVQAGAVEAIELLPAATFAWLDQALDVEVRAVDAYGNVATGHDAAIRLRSVGDLGDPVDATLEAGQAALAFTWDSPGLRDLLTVDDGSLSDSATIDALDPACAAPPVAVLTIDGDNPTVLCRLVSTGSTRTVEVSAAASVPGEAVLSRYHLQDEDGGWTVGTSPTWTRAWDSIGGRELGLVVADADACGAQAAALVYVGDPDGQPTGPVTVEPDASELSAGDGGVGGRTTLAIAATDCAGDPASTGALLIRADLGRVESGTTTVSTTGKGLQLSLDAAGEASVVWTVADEAHGGTGTVMIGRTGAAAWGQASLEVRNDGVRPTVVAVEPAGSTTQLLDSLRLTFSEALLSTSVTPSTVRLLDPDGAIISLAPADIDLEGHHLELWPPSPLDTSLGAYTVEVDSAVRDVDGNRLSGDWSGALADFSLRFGAVEDSAPDLSTCAVSPSILRPDGDDGGGEEGEIATISLVAGAAPDWWWMVVRDPQGTAVRTLWTPGDGGDSAALEWDGRGDDGLVVGNGSYTVALGAADDSWNTGLSCSKSVAIDNRLVAP